MFARLWIEDVLMGMFDCGKSEESEEKGDVQKEGNGMLVELKSDQ